MVSVTAGKEEFEQRTVETKDLQGSVSLPQNSGNMVMIAAEDSSTVAQTVMLM